MSKCRILFYHAKFGDGKFIDDGISFHTTFWNVIGLASRLRFKEAGKMIKHRFSHVEVWWPDENGCFEETAILEVFKTVCYLKKGTAFTSTMRGDDNGTVIRPASGILKHPERWSYIEIDLPEANYELAVEWAKEQAKNNQGYNKMTILNFFNPFRRTAKTGGKNICSVAVQGFLWQAGLFNKWEIMSPLKLWLELDRKGYETRRLV